MLKKIIAGSLAALLISSQLLCASAKGFSDVDQNAYSWAVTQINEMTDSGIINGFEDGTFRPANGVTRIDSLLLISRILGVNDETEQKIVELAENNYYADVNLLKYPAYQKNLAYILYRNMFTAAELRNFLAGDLGGQALKRYEAAVLLVKMTGNTSGVSKTDSVTLPFSDTNDIPKEAQPYVYYCYKNGLMKGMDGNKFEPMGTVTRAQMAVMLYNCMKNMDFSVVVGTVNEVSGFENSIKYTNEFGAKETFNNTGSVRITLNGEDITDLDKIASGDTVNIHYSGKTIFLVEALTVIKDETVEGLYAGKGASSTVTKILVRPVGGASTDTADYILADDVRVYLGDKKASLSDLKNGDHVKLTIQNSRVTIINAAERQTEVNGYIAGFTYEGQGSMDIKLSDNSVVTYKFTNSQVNVKRNGKEATIRELLIGDKVTATLNYELITAIEASSTTRNYEGTIEEIIISKKNPKIKINVGSEVIECAMDNSIEITINGEPATIYDMKLGYTAKVQTDSSTVTSVAITSTPSVDNVNLMGTVLEVNTNYASITLQLNDGTPTQVFVRKSANIINGTTGRSVTLSSIKKGSVITAVVSTSGFTSEAISIVVLETE